MRRPFVAGNWKMNTLSESARELALAVADYQASIDVLVAPPYPYLAAVAECLKGTEIHLAAQNASPEPPGAFTGEVAVEMLKDVGCGWVILGHSERRHVLKESDEFINRKVLAALAGGLNVILCVGELLSERQSNSTEAVLDAQLDGGLAGVDADAMSNVVIAYEPVWAIGTGVTATPDQAESAHLHLRKRLADRYNSDVAEQTRLQYGGSVKPDNALELLGQPNVDGALVGGASLKADAFLGIVKAGEQVAAGS